MPNVGAEGIHACIQEMIYLVKEGKITFTNTDGIIFLAQVTELCLAFESTPNTLNDSMSKLVDCLQAAEPSEEIKNEIAKLCWYEKPLVTEAK